MANPFVKAWKYLMAAFESKIDERADPKIQIQQAFEDEQLRHQKLSQQAANVIGSQRQLEMRLNRELGKVEKLQFSARQALVLADEARNRGDVAKAQQLEQDAGLFATELVSAEQSVERLKADHDQALQAATQAKQAVEHSGRMVRQKFEERSKLLTQLEQAKMQEQISASMQSMNELAAPGNTPSLEQVRDKIERRYANALGAAELAKNSVQGRMLELEQSALDMEGRARLEQIRASISGVPIAGEVTAGEPPSSQPPRAQG